jgi:hypothetical protein
VLVDHSGTASIYDCDIGKLKVLFLLEFKPEQLFPLFVEQLCLFFFSELHGEHLTLPMGAA